MSQAQESQCQEKVVKSYCRICEAHCGIEVKVRTSDQTILAVKPDKSHPVSKGYACIKGSALGGIHHDTDRVNHPLKKTPQGWVHISWAQALQEIGTKVKQLKRDFGPRSLAMYTGNPTYFNYKNILFSQEFMQALGSPNLYSSHSIDANNKLYVSTEVYGRSMVHPIPDFENTQFLLCLGSNPMVSQMSFLQIPNATSKLKEIEARGGRVIFVDPRKTETVSKVGEHQFIHPGTDVYLLLAILHELVNNYDLDYKGLNQYADGIDDLIALAGEWTVERCGKITGIDSVVLKNLARGYIESDGAALYMSTGVNMGPFGTLCYWLVQGLSLLSGNLDAKGGLLFPKGAIDILKVAELLGIGGESKDRTLKSGFKKVAGCFPVNALAEEITIDHPKRIRALFVSAGNPLHSIPGRDLDQAFKELELVVAVDMYRSETAERADYILPATDMLERSDYPISWNSLQPTPFAQYTGAVVPPKAERKEEWEIFSQLAIACGASFLGGACNVIPRINQTLSFLPGNLKATPEHILALLLRFGGEVSLRELKENKQGVFLPPSKPNSFLGKKVPTPNGKMNFTTPDILRDIDRVIAQEQGFLEKRNGKYLALIGQRERRSHNSWMHNAPHVKEGAVNAALMHPKDAGSRSLLDGQLVRLVVADGFSIDVPLKVTEDIMPGVLAVPHGWGHVKSGLSRAALTKGANINLIIPGGIREMEPPSGQAIMLSHPVEVSAAVV